MSSDDALGIRFLDSATAAAAPAGEACPICSGASKPALTVPAVKTSHVLTYFRCDGCASLFLSSADRSANFYQQADGEGQFGEASPFLKHYLEVGAGPDFMTRVLAPHLGTGARSFCSVGCGAGLDLDIVKRLSGGRVRVVGFEPNPYGRVQDLSVDIQAEPLTAEWLESTGQRFDVVFASEVIEHVPDPLGFARTMLKALESSQGAASFCLTTPNADLIRPGSPPGDVYAALFPGEHKIIFTQRALTKLLHDAGFLSVQVDASPHRLWGAAALGKALPSTQGAAGGEDHYIRYLQAFFSEVDVESVSPLVAGHAFRLFSELVNLDRLDEALDLVHRVKALRDLCDFVGRLPVLKAQPEATLLASLDFDDYVRSSRSFLAPFTFYTAMLARRKGDLGLAVDLFSRARRMLAFDHKLAPFYFQISCALLQPCTAELIQALAAAGRVEEAIDVWRRADEDGIAGVSLQKAMIRAFVDVANRGMRAESALLVAALDDLRLPDKRGQERLARSWSKEDVTLMFDYNITRVHHELAVRSDKMQARESFGRAFRIVMAAPTMRRLRSVMKAARRVV